MKFSVNWLREWVEVDLDPTALAERLTMGGLEVDEVSPAGATLDGVVVARITGTQPHPDADKLQVCAVDCGDEQPVTIVCGAANARPGLVAPLATVGAVLPSGMKIKPAKLRGVASQGMLCSASELALADDAAGLMELPADATPGQPLAELLQLDDTCIEIDLTPNRGDCLSIAGIAQDVAALAGGKFTPKTAAPVAPTLDEQRGIELTHPDECPRYLGRMVCGIDNRAETPLWMVEKLRRCGLRSIHPVVDVTNYVMLELGQPMHAFDASAISGPVSVRRARQGEALKLLDGTDVDLTEKLLVITDGDEPVALAGLMGGMASAVTPDTTDVFFEAAWFDPASIIGRARDLGVHSDAAHRFERGVDPTGQHQAIERATALLLEIAGGACGPVVEAVREAEIPTRPPVTLRRRRLDRLVGLTVDDAQVSRTFSDLGMAVKTVEGGWEVTPPGRRFDIELEVDLIEEVARVYGYDRLNEAIPGGDLPPVSIPEAQVPLARIAQVLNEAGVSEVVSYSFRSPDELLPMGVDHPLMLANPLSREMSAMRTSLIPGLLKALEHNQKRQQNRVALFETGRCFLPEADGSVRERDRIAVVAAGRRDPEQWLESEQTLDFFDVKGWLQGLIALSGLAGEFSYEVGNRAWLHPGQQAEVLRDGDPVGWVGTLHPNWQKKADCRGPVVAFEVDLAAIVGGRVPKALPVSRYPSIRRDLNVVVNKSVNWRSIQQIVEETVGNLLTSLVVFDEYTGKGIDASQRSLSFGLVMQDQDTTLTDETVDGVMSTVITRLHDQLGAELRG
ncbi:MAG: phenylalanine--tRNA ligase subunit beta [Pseudomonadota bacterium]